MNEQFLEQIDLLKSVSSLLPLEMQIKLRVLQEKEVENLNKLGCFEKKEGNSKIGHGIKNANKEASGLTTNTPLTLPLTL